MPGPNFRLSTLGGELLALTKSTHATPMFRLTDSAPRLEISALDGAGPLEMQTHRKCPPGWISLLEYALTKNAPASSLECALTNSLRLKSPRMNTYKKRGVGEVDKKRRTYGGGVNPFMVSPFRVNPPPHVPRARGGYWGTPLVVGAVEPCCVSGAEVIDFCAWTTLYASEARWCHA
jgi:hypothetical protein